MLRTAILAFGLLFWGCGAAAATETYPFSSHNARLTIESAGNLDPDVAKQVICVARNIYHESRGTADSNQLAVALVTRNRTVTRGMSYCEVVFERNSPRGRAQFSWTAYSHRAHLEKASWDKAQVLALAVVTDPTVKDITNGATHFFERNLRPDWSHRAESRVTIGSHTFVRLKPPQLVLAQAR